MSLSSDEARAAGYSEDQKSHTEILRSVFDFALERQETLRDLPTVASSESIESALSILPRTLPKKGLGDAKTLSLIKEHVVPALAQGQAGPRYFGFVIGGCLPSAQFGDFITTLMDQNAGLLGPTITPVIEDRALVMLLDLLKLPVEKFKSRTLTSGSTAANVLGLTCGREHAISSVMGKDYSVAEEGFGGIKVIVYADRAHASLAKAAAIVGIGKNNVVQLADTVEGIEEQLRSCGPGTGRAAIISLSHGEVNTGDFTGNVEAIRALCDKYDIWLHIDAAFGAFARLSQSLEHLAKGLELADSICSDGHKWLNVPYDCGLFFSRSVEIHAAGLGFSSLQQLPAYLNTSARSSESSETSPGLQELSSLPHPLTMNIESSRRFRALSVYCALLAIGADGYRDIIERNVQFARDVAEWMIRGEGSEWFEVLNASESVSSSSAEGGGEGERMTVPLNVVLFRAKESCPIEKFRPSQGPTSGGRLMAAINERREVFVSPGPDGALRIAVSNWMTGLAPNKAGKSDMEILQENLTRVMKA